MQPIDRPFRFTWDFCIVWAFLTVVMYFMTRHSEFADIPVSYYAELILLPFFATFLLYGPVLLARQIIRSGSRGWFVARIFLSILIGLILFSIVMYFTGHAEDASYWTGTVSFTAMVYLHWRLRDGPAP
jgi:hypothetical protein